MTKKTTIAYKITLQTPEEIFIAFTDLHSRQNNGRFYGLKNGFGHCFMILRFTDQWWVIDPLFNGIAHGRIRNDNGQLNRRKMLTLLKKNNCRVITLPGKSLTTQNRRKLSPLTVQAEMLSFGIFSCVTLVKRCLGIRRPWIITPYGLYRFFIRTKEENY